jgi:hypothetical protein
MCASLERRPGRSGRRPVHNQEHSHLRRCGISEQSGGNSIRDSRNQGCSHLAHRCSAEDVFFALPASPWQLGTNANTNGLLRQYFPKRIDLRVHSVADLRAVEERLNHRPPRVLGWRAPAQVFQAAVARRAVDVATRPGIRRLKQRSTTLHCRTKAGLRS